MTYEELQAENRRLRARIRELEQENARLKGYGSSDLVAQEINVFRRTSLELFVGEEKCTSFQAEVIPILAHREPVQHPLLDVSEQNLHIIGPGL